MKKINFRWVSETLSEREMKRVVGGLSCGSGADCPPGMTCSGGVCSPFPGTCGWRGWNVVTGEIVFECNTSQGHAIEMAQLFGGNWCCDSCGSTEYCG